MSDRGDLDGFLSENKRGKCSAACTTQMGKFKAAASTSATAMGLTATQGERAKKWPRSPPAEYAVGTILDQAAKWRHPEETGGLRAATISESMPSDGIPDSPNTQGIMATPSDDMALSMGLLRMVATFSRYLQGEPNRPYPEEERPLWLTTAARKDHFSYRRALSQEGSFTG
ncbi:UNVERIFIED_CONTAM: hypothetical protein K2H54_059384 [Gekko kuhli]